MKGIVKMSEYIVDLDMLKDVLSLIPWATNSDGELYVRLNDINKLIDSFAKEKYVREYDKNFNKTIQGHISVCSIMDDIKSGRGLKPLPKKHEY